ncbi:DUF1353 domain-containing protein [Actinospongicola halichondriae]|uniref:DUF1353 domain-containing protein n=1 Tax=Actinospongicola halichondriae TaxID=3236844 RepID=UPI003D583F05
MSRFTAPLLVTPMSDGRTWLIVTDDFRYEIGNEGSGDEIHVPQWMATDFASVPRPVWWFVAPWGRHGHAAVVHDAGYYLQTRSRRAYDRVFLEAMTVLGTNPVKARLMYLAVRAFGGLAWRANARRSAEHPGWKIEDPVDLGLPAGDAAVAMLCSHRDEAPSLRSVRAEIDP